MNLQTNSAQNKLRFGGRNTESSISRHNALAEALRQLDAQLQTDRLAKAKGR